MRPIFYVACALAVVIGLNDVSRRSRRRLVSTAVGDLAYAGCCGFLGP